MLPKTLDQAMPQTEPVLRTREDKANQKRKDEEHRTRRKDYLNHLGRCIPSWEKLTRPRILKKAVEYIQELLNPDVVVKSPEKLSTIHFKDIKEEKVYKRMKNEEYRMAMNEGYNLLRKWVPGTATSSRVEVLKKTVKYIEELQQRSAMKKREKRLKKQEKNIQEIEHKKKELETSQKAINTSPREPHSSPSEAEVVLARDPTGVSKRKITTMDAAVQTTSEAEWVTLDEVGSPEEKLPEFIPDEELLESRIPDFNSMEDFRQWIEL
jgi:myosin heavy subunit